MSAILLSLGVQIEHFTFSETPQSARVRAHVLQLPDRTSFVNTVWPAVSFSCAAFRLLSSSFCQQTAQYGRPFSSVAWQFSTGTPHLHLS
jgi:hypothetical protein